MGYENKQDIEIDRFRFEIKESCGPCDGKPSVKNSPTTIHLAIARELDNYGMKEGIRPRLADEGPSLPRRQAANNGYSLCVTSKLKEQQ